MSANFWPWLQDKLVKVAKKLKKNNVAVDVVAFGSEETNGDKLESFINAVNSGDNSHLITVPAGTILSDILFGSPIFQIDGGAGYGAAPGADSAVAGGDAFEFGVDPNMDPELAMALRVSMQEERARQEAANAAAASADGTTGEAGLQPDILNRCISQNPWLHALFAWNMASMCSSCQLHVTATTLLVMIIYSMCAACTGPSAGAAGESDKAVAPAAPADEATPMDEDALLQQALAMSMQARSLSFPGMPLSRALIRLSKCIRILEWHPDSAASLRVGGQCSCSRGCIHECSAVCCGPRSQQRHRHSHV